MAHLSRCFRYANCVTQSNQTLNVESLIPCITTTDLLHNTGFWLLPFRSPLLRESLRFLFLALLRCFSSGRSPLYPIYSDTDT